MKYLQSTKRFQNGSTTQLLLCGDFHPNPGPHVVSAQNQLHKLIMLYAVTPAINEFTLDVLEYHKLITTGTKIKYN